MLLPFTTLLTSLLIINAMVNGNIDQVVFLGAVLFLIIMIDSVEDKDASNNK